MTKSCRDRPRCFSNRPAAAAAGGRPDRMPTRRAAPPACGAERVPRAWPAAGRDRGGRRLSAAIYGRRPE